MTTRGQVESVQRGELREYQISPGSRPWVPVGGAVSGHVFWVSHGRSLYRQDLTAATKAAARSPGAPDEHIDPNAGSRVSLPSAPTDVVADGEGGIGIYVELGNPNDLPTVASLRYYSATALAAASPQPTAVRDAGEVEGLAADPAGGVVYTDSNGALIHWTPARAALR